MTDPSFNRLIVELPLRHGKSHYCSWMLPAWFLLLWPDRQVILSTYQHTFAGEWSQRVLSTLRDYGPHLTGLSLGDIRRRDHFTIAGRRGQLRTASPGAGVAGKGADLVVADDLVRDMREVANPARRHGLDVWVNAELLARLEPDGKALFVMSRRHPDDQSGRLLAQNADLPPAQRWHTVRMPAIDPDGNALWPERYPLERLLAVKRRYELAGMSYLWSCLYQQEPAGDSTMVEWAAEDYWRGIGYDALPPDLPARWRLLSLDPSKGKGSRRGDYSAWSDGTLDRQGTLWVRPTLLVTPTDRVEDQTVAMLERGRYDGLIVECNGFQEAVADNIARKCAARGVRCPLFKHVNTEDKVVRIRLDLTPLLSQGRVRLDASSPHYPLALGQLREFPTAAHDDFPDSLSLLTILANHLLTGKR